MGTIREAGYREYDDKGNPGRGGLSNLLFDQDGALIGHAIFHTTEREETTDSSDIPDIIVKVLAVVGVVALAVVTVQGVRHAVKAARAKRARDSEATAEVEADEQAALAVNEEALGLDAAAEVVDADDVLIEEVRVLIEESNGSVQEYQDRRAAAVEESPVDEMRATRSKKRRTRW